MTDSAQSEAVILLLGRGTKPYPQRDPQRVIDRFGEPEGIHLVYYTEQLLDELYAVVPDWSNDLQEVTAKAVEIVRRAHPEPLRGGGGGPRLVLQLGLE
jgi:hypothetical protein